MVVAAALGAGAACDRGVEHGDGREAPARARATVDEVTDDAGVRHSLEVPPRRIVSLVPAATEVLRVLAADTLLVARTDFDTASALSHLPSVGGGLHPSLEALSELRPELVIRFSGPQDEATPRRLSAMGIRHFAVRPDGIEDVRRMIRSLARIVDEVERGEELVSGIDDALEEVARRTAQEPPVRVAYLTGGSPPWAAGPGTFIDELLEIAGGSNAFHDLGSLYAAVSLEELAVREIDMILVPAGARTGVRVPGVEVREVSALTLSPGPRLAEAAREIAVILHPGAFR
jgi:iron complex transport system substrate-binding protein